MGSKSSILTFTIFALALGSYAAIGPVADLHIVNKDLAPDGVTRPTILAGGTFPGPLITGQKVREKGAIICSIFANIIYCRAIISNSMLSTNSPTRGC